MPLANCTYLYRNFFLLSLTANAFSLMSSVFVYAEQIVALQASRDAANRKCERLSGKVQTLRDALEGKFEK